MLGARLNTSQSFGPSTRVNTRRFNSYSQGHWVSEDSYIINIDLPHSSTQQEKNAALLDANRRVMQWTQGLINAAPTWLTNYVPSYTSLLITVDIIAIDHFAVMHFLQSLAQKIANNASQEHLSPPSEHIIEVCYDATLAKQPNDLIQVSEVLGLPINEIIKLHTEAVYRVFAVGFLPNFAYMGLTAAQLNMPRLSSPRAKVPAGAVAIADNQTAIYPQVSPGGWHILGYTPSDMSGHGDIVYKAGDTVKFEAISVDEYRQKRDAKDD
jgi:KipI family sensor histidine kinase inhibitor